MAYQSVITKDENGNFVTIETEIPDQPEHVPTSDEIVNALTKAVQMYLDATARLKNYDGILSACTYATDPDPVFQSEGQACVVWRSACWAKSYEVMAEVQAGTRPIPTAQELIGLMPVSPW